MKTKLYAMVLLAACSANVQGEGDDGGGDDGVGGVGAGNDEIRFRVTAVADERADTIDFATGEPVHAHAKAATPLGAADCAEVYKYAYLMSATAPVFGRETTPNPLAWTIEAKGAAEYRVRTETATLRDWTPVEGDAIELHRDGVATGKHLLDVRVGESVATTCFVLHPLAAPLEARPPTPVPGGLASMTFAAAAPMSRLFTPELVPVFAQAFAHHTAESIDLVIDAAKPAATFGRRGVDEYVALPLIAKTTGCLDINGPTGEEICFGANEVPPGTAETVTGSVADTRWSLQILDEATNAPTSHCAVTELRAVCRLPARDATAAAQRYRVVLALANVRELAPFGTDQPIAEHTLVGTTFTGRILDTQKRCAEFRTRVINGVEVEMCIREAHYVRMHALDKARLEIATSAITFTTDGNPLAPFAVPAYAWDAGDADLPGPQ